MGKGDVFHGVFLMILGISLMLKYIIFQPAGDWIVAVFLQIVGIFLFTTIAAQGAYYIWGKPKGNKR